MKAFVFFFFHAALIISASAQENFTQAERYQSIVRIEVVSQTPDYQNPWNPGRFSSGIGSGFLIGDNQFLTNAHVVSNARRILITQPGSSRKHPARVVHIAHDCDLALLEVDDFSPFENYIHFKLDGVPPLESTVSAIGYPVGGDRISVTRGVVSRIDFRPYSHSRADSHLVIQIDAAINPGNSGGPVFLGENVVGVAFQGLRSADNTGYMIPTPVIKRFLKDIEDGKYDQYVELGASIFPLYNPAMRKALRLDQNSSGVLVSSVTPESATDGVLEPGDVLLSIDSHPIDQGGKINLDGERLELYEIAERKFAGDQIPITFLREGKSHQKNITLTTIPASRLYAITYGKRPRYYYHAGLVFQPLDLNLYAAKRFNSPRVRKIYQHYMDDGIFKERKDIIVLTQVFDDQITLHASKFKGAVLDSINGTRVSSLKQLSEVIDQSPESEEFLTFEFNGVHQPLVLPREKAKKASAQIMQTYGISKDRYLGN